MGIGSKEDIAKDVKICIDANYSTKEIKNIFPKVIPKLVSEAENMGNVSSSTKAIVTPSGVEGLEELVEVNVKVNSKVAEDLETLIKSSLSCFNIKEEAVEAGCQ